MYNGSAFDLIGRRVLREGRAGHSFERVDRKEEEGMALVTLNLYYRMNMLLDLKQLRFCSKKPINH